jgi:hypothetical protein
MRLPRENVTVARAGAAATVVLAAKQSIVLAVSGNDGAELLAYALP